MRIGERDLMNNQKETIRKFVNYLNNSEHLGGFWLPSIQRQFVWNEDQIERLYDSILREYPIGSLLIWKNQSIIKHRKFVDNYKKTLNLLDFAVPPNKNNKMLVLDGQQRLQSLFIGLKGSYETRELYFNILSGDMRAPDDKRFEFKFMNSPKSSEWIKFSTLVFPDKKNKEFKKEIVNIFERNLESFEEDRIEENIELIRNVFCTQENIIYQEVDSIDRPDSYTEDDIVEIFIRANSGGTKLDKSDLLFSLLVSSWEKADEEMDSLLKELNRDGFRFGRDFILKTCLVVFNKGARYEVEKFRDGSTKRDIENNWDQLSKALFDVKDFIRGTTFIQCDKVLTSYLALIPLIYFRYHFKTKWESSPSKSEFLVRSLLAGAFGGSPDSLIDKIIKKINDIKDFDIKEIYGVIIDDGRNLELSKDNLLGISYSDKRIHLLFSIWYDFNYKPSYVLNEPQLDHIFPQSLLKTVKVLNTATGHKTTMKYTYERRDLLGNMMLLKNAENGSGGKTDTPPEVWFAGKSDAYLDLHLIPKDRNLWKLEKYEEFIAERNKLILNKFEFLLTKEKT